MAKITKHIDPDIHFRVLNALEENPHITQRELAQKLGVSLGGINFCLKALVEIGHLKINNFQKYMPIVDKKCIAMHFSQRMKKQTKNCPEMGIFRFRIRSAQLRISSGSGLEIFR